MTKKIIIFCIIFICFLKINVFAYNNMLPFNNTSSIEDSSSLESLTYIKFRTEHEQVMKNLTYKKIKGGNLKLDLYFPELVMKKHPIIIFLHGGSFVHGDKEQILAFEDIFEVLKSKGFIIASIEYRLVSRSIMFPANIEDVKDSIKWLRANAKQYTIDESKIGVFGYSAGGNLALMAGLTEDNDFIGEESLKEKSGQLSFIISYAGPTDLLNENDFSLHQKIAFVALGNELGDEVLKKASPINYLDFDAPPILLFHGKKDRVVPFAQSEIFHTKARAIGVDSKLIQVDGGHTITFGIRPHVDLIKKHIIDFLEELNFKM